MSAFLAASARMIAATPAIAGRIEWAKALAIVATGRQDDLSETTWRSLLWRAGCLACMACGRRGIAHHPFGEGGGMAAHHALTLGRFDYRPLYAGYEVKVIHFHPRQMRYDIEKDGDWCM